MLAEELTANWKTVVDTIQEGVMIVDPSGTIVSVNRALAEMTGFGAQDLVGRSCGALNCASCRLERAPEGPHWCSLFKSGLLTRQRCSLVRRDGTEVQVLKNASVLRDVGGRVIGAVETITDLSGLLARDTTIEAFRRELDNRDTFHGMVGVSPPMQRFFDLLDNAAGSEAPLLLLGESGTGKELAARAVHERGPRRHGPYVKVNCAALNEALLESELFGHVRGAFTGAHQARAGRFEAASGGTIFLDEIGDLPALTQVKLLRVLEERVIERVGDNRPVAVDVRILSATNRDLAAMGRAGSVREDLLYRINVLPVTIPPVRERPGDVPLLAESFLRKMQLRTGRDIRAISAAAMHLLMTYPWPGNVRELRSTFEYAFVTCQGETIEPEHLPPTVRNEGPLFLLRPVKVTATATGSREERQRRELVGALTEAGGNQSRAAELLGISRVTVWKRMKRYGVRAERQVRE